MEEVRIEDFTTWLDSQSTNTIENPYEVKITFVNYSSNPFYIIKRAMTSNPQKYLDLSYTDCSINNFNFITDMQYTFENCVTLVKSPILPKNVTNMYYTFRGCTSLTTAPTIPNNVINMMDTFIGCTSLSVAPIIPLQVENMSQTFMNCTTLTECGDIPNSVTNMSNCFRGCTNLITVGKISNRCENLSYAFYQCSSLLNVGVIPESVVTMDCAFYQCSSIKKVSLESNENIAGNTALNDVFYECLLLEEFKVKKFLYSGTLNPYPSSIFTGCSNLTKFYSDTPYNLYNWLYAIYQVNINPKFIPTEPSEWTFYLFSTTDSAEIEFADLNNSLSTLTANTTSAPFNIKVTELSANDLEDSATSGTLGYVLNQNSTKYVDLSETIMPNATDLTSTFENCTTLVESPYLPSTVTVLDSTYNGCSNLAKITEVPSGVTDLTECFKNCSSLEEIEDFNVPLSVLKSNAEDCFSGCTSLTSIGINKVDPAEVLEWHAMRLNFGADNVSGKVYDKDKNTTTIPQTTIVKGTLSLPIKTDELWFPPANATDSDIDAIIESVIDTKRTYFNKPVLNPNNKSFVLWKGDNSNFVSNIDFGGGGGSGITVYPTEEDIIEDLPNLNDDDIVASYGDGEGFNDAPLGTIAAYYGTTDPSGGKWLICDGRDTTGTVIELETHYPSLYMFLGGTNVLPDYSGGTNAKIIKATTTAEINPLPSESVAEIESFTTSFVASKLSNLLQVDKIFATPITSTGATTSLISGKKFSDYDFIISQVSFYTNAQNNFMPIPISEVQDCITNHSTNAEWFLQGASTGGTDRRVGFTILSDTTFKVTMINGTSGNMPRFQAFYGIKFNLS